MIKDNNLSYQASQSSFSLPRRPFLDETPAFDVLFPKKLSLEDKEALEAIKEELEKEEIKEKEND